MEDIFRANVDMVVPASQYPTAKDDLDMDLIQMIKNGAVNVGEAQGSWSSRASLMPGMDNLSRVHRMH